MKEVRNIINLFILKIDIIAKKEKAEERQHRLVVKGRRVLEHRPIGLDSKNKKENNNNSKGNDDFNMLIYDNNDD